MGLGQMKEMMDKLTCSTCKTMSKFDLIAKSIDGVIFNIIARCKLSSCIAEFKVKSQSSGFNTAFWTAMTVNGILPTQMQEFLLDLNFTTSGDGRKNAIDILSDTNIQRRKEVMEKIVVVCRDDQKKAMAKLLQSEPRELVGMVDGAYPTKGFFSKTAFVTLMLMIDGKPMILYSVIVKKKKKKSKSEIEEEEKRRAEKRQEGQAGNEDGDIEDDEEVDEDDEDSVWTEVNSNGLEGECHRLWIIELGSYIMDHRLMTFSGCGLEVLLNGPVKQLIDAGFTLRLSVDGDLKMQERLKMLPGVKLCFDIAHLKKNVQKNVKSLLQATDYFGDSMRKYGNENFRLLCNGIKTAQMDCANGTREHGWTESDIIKRMSASVDHFAGEYFI